MRSILSLLIFFCGLWTVAAQDNQVEALQRIAAAQESNATLLDLSNLGLTEVPPQVWQLTQLEELHLNINHISELPPEIGNLTNLRFLMLTQNQLHTLPPEIGQLQQLQILHVNVNRLITVPPEIGQLQQLQLLNLSINQITVLPPEIGTLQNLRQLFLGQNQLRHLPIELANLSNLESLFLDHNPLISPPQEIIAAGVPAIQEYLGNQTSYHVRQEFSTLFVFLAAAMVMIGLVVGYALLRSNTRKKKKRR
jgi:Leucine-rich repeat (LRR) protein